MRLEHINIVVSDIERSLVFYKAAFPHWKVRAKGEADWFGIKRNWVHFGDDFNFITLNDNGTGENRLRETNQLGLAHFAYVTNNVEAVVKRLVDAGFEVSIKGGENPHRANYYFNDPDGFEVEFVQYFSDIPEERNNED